MRARQGAWPRQLTSEGGQGKLRESPGGRPAVLTSEQAWRPLQKLESSAGGAHHEIVLVRAALPDDIDFIRELAGAVFTLFGDYRKLLPKWFRTPGVMTFVSESEGARTGYVMLAFFREGRALVGDVLAIAVDPPQQARGIGRMLLQHAVTVCEQVSEQTPVRAMRLSVADTNDRAQRLFLSFGFKKVEGDFGRYDGGQQALHMERPMAP
jgi:ribosomal protein S18 acetylase RimI-like enzyme